MGSKSEIGSTIKLLRKERDKSLKEVADEAAISKSYLWDIENGIGSPDLTRITDICSALDADPVALLLKSKAEKDLPLERRKLLRDYRPIIEKIERMIEDLYDEGDDDGKPDCLKEAEEETSVALQ